MSEWRECPRCGKEYPITMYPRLEDGRAEVCKKCWCRLTDSPESKTRQGAWSREDHAKIAEMTGKPISEVAKALGRSESAIRHRLPYLGLCIRRGRIEEKG